MAATRALRRLTHRSMVGVLRSADRGELMSDTCAISRSDLEAAKDEAVRLAAAEVSTHGPEAGVPASRAPTLAGGMPCATTSITSVTVVMLAAGGVSAVAAAGLAATPSEDLAPAAASHLAAAIHHFAGLVRHGLDRQPTLMLAGAAAAAVPVVAGVATLLRALGRLRAPEPGHDSDAPVTTGRAPARTAWIEVEDVATPPVRIGELVRIGCSDDCDLALGGAGLAELHALIQRTPESEFFIFDVSDAKAGGVAVNGAPARRSRLRDGDRIAIGTARVVFRTDQETRSRGLTAAT